MIRRLPKHVPSLELMLNDLSNPSPEALAKAMGVARTTVYRWLRKGEAPRPVMLALFWITRWGVSDVHCAAHNDAVHQAQLAAMYRSRVEELEAKLEHMERIGDFGAANDPMAIARRRAPALPVIAVPGEAPPASNANRKKTAAQKRAELVEQRLAKRAEGPPKPFDFLRTG